MSDAQKLREVLQARPAIKGWTLYLGGAPLTTEALQDLSPEELLQVVHEVHTDTLRHARLHGYVAAATLGVATSPNTQLG